MSAVYQPPAQQTFFLTKLDVNGLPYTVPNAGGFVSMYEPGSSVPKTTWLDSDQTTANPNPIRLDPQGRAVIYGLGQYRQLVTDQLGNEQWDQLIELGVDGTFVNAALFQQPVTVSGPNPNPPLNNPDQGPRALASVLGSFVDARNGRFGALRQGGDDLTVIQAAVNYAASIGGATVYLGPGPLTTQPTTQCVWPAAGSGVSLKGDGPLSTVLSINGNLFQDVFALVSGNLAHCQIRDMGFSCPGVGTNGALIHYVNAYAAHVENVRMAYGFWDGVVIEGGTNQYLATIRDLICPANGTANACIVVGGDLTGVAQGVYIDTCKLANSQFGIYLRNASGVEINDTECLDHPQNGVITSPPPGKEVAAIQATGLLCDTCTGAAWNFGTSGGAVGLISLSNCWAASSLQGIIIAAGPTINTISIVGCQIHDNKQQGIHNLGANAVLVTNNLLGNNGGGTPNTFDAIQIDSCIQNVVGNNFIGGAFGGTAAHRYAVSLNGTADYCIINGNVTGSGGTGTILNAASGTHNLVGAAGNTGT